MPPGESAIFRGEKGDGFEETLRTRRRGVGIRKEEKNVLEKTNSRCKGPEA